jgi:hypothetical protein
VTVDDASYFQMMFGDDSTPRKEFMFQWRSWQISWLMI